MEGIKILPKVSSEEPEIVRLLGQKVSSEESETVRLLRQLTTQNLETQRVLSNTAGVLSALVKIVQQSPAEPAWIAELRSAVDKLSVAMIAIVRPRNPDTIEVHQLILSAASTAQQFPALLMPWDHSVVIKALSANGGTIYIAGSKQDAEDTSRSYPLAAGETIEYKINDLSALWAAASVATEGLIWTTEAQIG